jgi:hypothetical protein
MTLSALGIFSAAGAGAGVGDYELIRTEIVSGTSTSSVVFSNLADFASTYKHLQIRYIARSATGAAADSLGLRFNGDTGANYTSHKLEGDGSSVTSSADVSASTIGLGASLPAASAASNIFGSGVIDILDTYSTTKNKTTRSLYGMTGVNRIVLHSGVYRSTTSTTSLTVNLSSAANFAAGSRFSIYGIRG